MVVSNKQKRAVIIFVALSFVTIQLSFCEEGLVKKSSKFVKKIEVNKKYLANNKIDTVLVADINTSAITDVKNITALSSKNQLFTFMNQHTIKRRLRNLFLMIRMQNVSQFLISRL